MANFVKVKYIGGRSKETATHFQVWTSENEYYFVSNIENAKWRDEVLSWQGTIEQELNDVELLQKVKSDKITQLETTRKALQSSNFIWNDKEFTVSSIAKQNMIGRVVLSQSDAENIVWLDVYGNQIPMTIGELKKLCEAVARRESYLYMTEAHWKSIINETVIMDDNKNIQLQETINAIKNIKIEFKF